MRKDGSPKSREPWYQRVLRPGHRGKQGHQSQRNTMYVIIAAVAVCTLVVCSVTYEMDFKDSTDAEVLGTPAEPTVQKAVRKFADNKVVDQAKVTAEEAIPIAEDVKTRLAAVEKKMQNIFKSNPKFTKFGPRIEDWDEQREIVKAKLFGNDMSSRKSSADAAADQVEGSEQPRILLVTSSHPQACSNDLGDQMLLKAIKNKIDYCRLHKIEIFYNMDKIDDEMTNWWVKVFLTHMLMLKHPEVDWIWWMDSDAIFTDMSFELPFHKYENYNMVLHGWDEALYRNTSWLSLNAGVFLLRNCQWSLDLLYTWAPMSPKGPIRDAIGPLLTEALPDRPLGEADDQSGLVYLILLDREKWGSKVYLESSYYFQGYWRILTEKFEEMMAKYKPGVYGDDRWPFVTHFCGCEFCEGVINAGYTAEACISQMERAFNFADNQVINLYGFRHTSLEMPTVKSIGKAATAST